MEQFTGTEQFLLDLEQLLIQQELMVIEWKKRVMQAQDFDEAIRLKEVQWALQECLDKINPKRAIKQQRQMRIKHIYENNPGKKEE